jgi:chromosome segregation ATPase
LPAGAPGAAAAALASYGTASVLDDFDEGFAKLPELEVEKVERRSGDRVVAREPAEVERETELSEADAVRALARFNDAPDGLIASVQYALHVTGRLFSLRKERAVALEQQRKAAEEHKAALVALGQALMAQAADKRMEPLRSKVAHVHDERAKLERADQSVERTREGNERALNLMRSEAEHLKEELEPYVAAEKTALDEQRKADAEVRRAQAMQKRVEIELRALESAVTADEAKRDALHAQLEQREETVTALTAALAEANEALGKARRDLALKRGALDLNEEKQKRLEAESRARELEAEGHKQAANGAYEAALCDLSETAKKQKLDALAPEQTAKVKASGAALEAAGLLVLRFDRALKLYDRRATVRGFLMIAGFIALVVVALVLR